MKRKLFIPILALLLTAALLFLLGIGPYSSASAVQDLKTELQTLYGCEYTGKQTDNGTEDMTFVIQPKTWFLTNWNLRNTFGLDYQYECQVIFTTHTDTAVSTRTVTYQAIDPMGADNLTARAHLDLNSEHHSGNGA